MPTDDEEPVGASLEDDLLAAGQQLAGVTHRCRRSSGSRVRPGVHLTHALARQVGIELGGADASMAQQRLDHPQIGAAGRLITRKEAPVSIRVGDRLPEGTLTEFYEQEAPGCSVGTSANISTASQSRASRASP